MPADVQLLSRQWERVRSARSVAEAEWEEIAQYAVPERRGFTSDVQTEGQKRTEFLFDPIGPNLVRYLATSLEGLAFPQEESWFSLKIEGVETEDLPKDWRDWLENASDATRSDFYNPESGGQAALSMALTDMVAFGPTAMLIDEHPPGDPDFKVRNLDLRNSYIETDSYGKPVALFCSEKLTAEQIRDRFPDKTLPRAVQDILDRNGDYSRKFPIVSVFKPRDYYDKRVKTAAEMPFAYCVWEDTEKFLIEEGGFREQPFLFPRWGKVIGESYSWAPGRQALPGLKSFNILMKRFLRHAALNAELPLALPDDAAIRTGAVKPGAFVPYSVETAAKLGGRVPVQPLQLTGSIQDPILVLQMMQKGLEEIFLKYLFSLPVEGPAMTAFEVATRKQQFVQQIGPVYGNLVTDLARPLVNRCVSIKLERGAFGPPPQTALPGVKEKLGKDGKPVAPLRIEFVSPVQKAVDQLKGELAGRGLAALQAVVAVDQSVIGLYDWDKIATDTTTWQGWPAAWELDPEVVAKGRQAQAQQAAADKAAAQATEAAKAAPGLEKAVPGIVPGLLNGMGLTTPPGPARPAPGGFVP